MYLQVQNSINVAHRKDMLLKALGKLLQLHAVFVVVEKGQSVSSYFLKVLVMASVCIYLWAMDLIIGTGLVEIFLTSMFVLSY